MYAIIKCGGKQYKVSEGDIIDIDYTGKAAKETLEITDVLAVNNGELKNRFSCRKKLKLKQLLF